MALVEDLLRQLIAVRDAVGIHASNEMGHLRIAGADAPTFLHRIVTNEVQKQEIGTGHYNAILDRKGMVLSLFYLLRLAQQEFHLVTPPELKEKTLGILVKLKLIEKVTIVDRSMELGHLSLIGSRAEETLRKKCGYSPSTADRLESIGPDLLCWSEGIFKRPWIHLVGPRVAMEDLTRSFSDQAAPLEGRCLRILRREAAFPEYGIDIDDTHILLEADLPFAYQRQKGCYPGQEVVERILAYGKGKTPRKLRLLRLDGDESIAPGTEIDSQSGEKAGSVTSSLFHPLEGKTLVLAYLDLKHVEDGNSLKRSDARLVLEPESLRGVSRPVP